MICSTIPLDMCVPVPLNAHNMPCRVLAGPSCTHLQPSKIDQVEPREILEEASLGLPAALLGKQTPHTSVSYVHP